MSFDISNFLLHLIRINHVKRFTPTTLFYLINFMSSCTILNWFFILTGPNILFQFQKVFGHFNLFEFIQIVFSFPKKWQRFWTKIKQEWFIMLLIVKTLSACTYRAYVYDCIFVIFRICQAVDEIIFSHILWSWIFIT